MHVEYGMSLKRLAEEMGGDPSYEETKEMRELLIEDYYGMETYSIDRLDWNHMVTQVCG